MLVAFLLVAAWFVSSCETEPAIEPSGNTEDYKFAGSWSGNTSQQKTVSFTIDTIDKWAQVINIAIVYKTDSVDLNRIYTNINGITKISDGCFTIDLPENVNVHAFFQDDTILTGVINVLKGYDSSEYLEIPFTAVNEIKPTNIHSRCMTSFKIGDEPFFFEQDMWQYYAYSDNGLTDSAVFILASFCRKSYIPDGQRIITIKKGSFYNTTNLINFFAPGTYPYSFLADNGIEILYFHPEEYYQPWSTSFGAAGQDSSYFRILNTLFVHEFTNEVMIKFQAEFACNLYKRSGEKFRLTNGKFLGYARYIRD